MKKFFMTLAVVMIAVCANAQVYLGGNVGIASVDYGGDDDETIYSLLPEIGYKFNDNWAAGVMFGWSKAGLQIDNGEFATSERLTTHTFEISPLCTLYIPAQQTYQRILRRWFRIQALQRS